MVHYLPKNKHNDNAALIWVLNIDIEEFRGNNAYIKRKKNSGNNTYQ